MIILHYSHRFIRHQHFLLTQHSHLPMLSFCPFVTKTDVARDGMSAYEYSLDLSLIGAGEIWEISWRGATSDAGSLNKQQKYWYFV